MSEKTKIEWCDSTLNFWSGCTKVSAGCANCYAEALSDRKLTDAKGNLTIGQWGKGAPRKLHESAFRQALALNRKPWVCACGKSWKRNEQPAIGLCDCGEAIHRRRIFSLSLGDWLDPEVPVEWLARMLDTVRKCDQVTWILCTKRPELWRERCALALETCIAHWEPTADNFKTLQWAEAWLNGNPSPNVILLASVENQQAADERIPQLLRIPAACRGLSLEPLLGPVVLPQCNGRHDCPLGNAEGHSDLPFGGISWLIIGGESGPSARPCNMDWIRVLVAQGKAAGVATFVKQLGANPCETLPEQTYGAKLIRLKDKKGGDWNEWSEDLRVRQWPCGF